MGFGPLLIGYFITFIVTLGLGNYLFAGMLIGGFIMFLGLTELRKYAPTFLYAIIANVVLILCSFYEAAAYIDDAFLLGLGICDAAISTIFAWVELAVYLIFNIAMLYGIADLSRRVDLPETRQKAYRNMVFVAMYNVFYLVINIPNTIFANDIGFFMTLLMILQLIYTIINLALIFKCYAMICPEGEEDMPVIESKNPVIRKMDAVIAKREENAKQAAIDLVSRRRNRDEKKPIVHKKKKK
jgi:hypothetical protein